MSGPVSSPAEEEVLVASGPGRIVEKRKNAFGSPELTAMNNMSQIWIAQNQSTSWIEWAAAVETAVHA
jgi:hypothetical protein